MPGLKRRSVVQNPGSGAAVEVGIDRCRRFLPRPIYPGKDKQLGGFAVMYVPSNPAAHVKRVKF
jgi:hypothetical protein